MFILLRYGRRVRHALAELGVSTPQARAVWMQAKDVMREAPDASPEEAALSIVGRLPIERLPDNWLGAGVKWLDEGKISRDRLAKVDDRHGNLARLLALTNCGPAT